MMSNGGGLFTFLGLLILLGLLVQYWWVILLIIGAVILLGVFSSKSDSSKTEATFRADTEINPERQKAAADEAPEHRAQVATVQKNPYYEQKISQMKARKAAILKKKEDFHKFLDSTFQDSEITKNRDASAVDEACEVAILKMRTLRRAYDAYGIMSDPSPECRERTDRIISDVDLILSRIDPVIDELLDMEQSRLDGVSVNVDSRLKELQETTNLYAR